MNDPINELPTLINTEYLNPLIWIESKPDSRELMLSIYKYSRGFDPREKNGIVNYTLNFQPMLFPYLKISIRILTLIKFQYEENSILKNGKRGKWLISRLEDCVTNEDLMNAFIPYSKPFLNYFKSIGGLVFVGVGKIMEVTNYYLNRDGYGHNYYKIEYEDAEEEYSNVDD
ncbi:12520_t:CDS:2 [Entrophospora sp. SA101]|nr:12520_t:CDS:2 [Entrophospora sp. SA101]